MISVTQALEQINQTTKLLLPETKALKDAFGAVLAANVYTPIDSPPFAQSAMDGYAVSLGTKNGTEGLAVQGIIAAGHKQENHLENDKAFRIFTGAPMPHGADTVLIQELITIFDGKIFWNATHAKKGANIRGQASQLAKGALAAPKGTKLGPGAIGFLASLGVTHVDVYRQPKIGILVTGDELVQPGNALHPGQIFESNGLTLQAALAEGGIAPTAIVHVADSQAETTSTLRNLIKTNDIVLVTGGISVGDFDFVHEALANNAVQQGFYKVAQKPGKPMYFGSKEHTLVFGLPGNPASVLTCFYVYVLPAIRKLRGQNFAANNMAVLPLQQSATKKDNLTQFMKARLTNTGVELLEGQESYKMHAFTAADALAILPAGRSEFALGDPISVLDLTKCWS